MKKQKADQWLLGDWEGQGTMGRKNYKETLRNFLW